MHEQSRILAAQAKIFEALAQRGVDAYANAGTARQLGASHKEVHAMVDEAKRLIAVANNYARKVGMPEWIIC